MKKIIPALLMLLYLSSCSNSKDTKIIWELENQVIKLENEVTELKETNNKQLELLWDFDEQKKEILEEQIELEDQVDEMNNKNDSFLKNQECLKYKDWINSKEKWWNVDQIFYSKKYNSCLHSIIYFSSKWEIQLISIINTLTSENIKSFFCNDNGKNCTWSKELAEYNNEINNYK